MSGYWATPDPWVILALGVVWVGCPVGLAIAATIEDRRARRCTLITNGGMHCSGRRRHDGPHTFTNKEWRRTR